MLKTVIKKLLFFFSVCFMLLMFLLAVFSVLNGEFQAAMFFGIVFVGWWVVKGVVESIKDRRADRAYQRWLNDPNVPFEHKQQEIERRRAWARYVMSDYHY